MVENTGKSALERITAILAARGVEFIVIGGQAEMVHGSPRVTYDVDLCYRRTRGNLQKLAEALRELKPTLRGAPPDLPFTIDAQSLALGSNFTFRTPIVDLDLLSYVEPLGEYDALLKHAQTVRVGDLDLKIISLDDLITVKQHIRRPKDQEALFQLLAIKRLRDQQKQA